MDSCLSLALELGTSHMNSAIDMSLRTLTSGAVPHGPILFPEIIEHVLKIVGNKDDQNPRPLHYTYNDFPADIVRKAQDDVYSILSHHIPMLQQKLNWVPKCPQEIKVPLSFTADLRLIRLLLDEGRVHEMKEVIFDPYVGDSFDMIKRFSESNSKLTRIRFTPQIALMGVDSIHNRLWYRLESCFSKIIESSSQHLESILMFPAGFLQWFHFPREMPNLKSLTFNIDDYNCQNTNQVGIKNDPIDTKLFPQSISLSQRSFRSVQKVSIVWKPSLSKNFPFEASFPESFVMESVTELSLQSVPSAGNWLEMISKSFPNVRVLQVEDLHSSDSLRLFLRKVFPLFAKLEKLIMNKIRDRGVVEVEYMDSCVTGMNEDECKELRLRLDASKENAMLLNTLDIDELREHPSLLHMKNLKSLTLRSTRSLYHNTQTIKLGKKGKTSTTIIVKKPESEMFSNVGRLYAFFLHPHLNLKVDIE